MAREPRFVWPAVIAAAAFAAGGCAGFDEYVYAPEPASARVDGYPATRVDIPPERPQGEVQLTSFGVTGLRAGDRDLPALHVRMTVDNQGDARGWVIDTREQLIEIPDEGRGRAMFVNSDVARTPIVTAGLRERRTLDLYFPVPAGVRDADDLASFELLWKVHTGQRPIEQRTGFQRIEREYLGTSTAKLESGGGPYWWYDPAYHTHLYVNRPLVIIRDRPRRVIVQAPPSRHYRAPGRRY